MSSAERCEVIKDHQTMVAIDPWKGYKSSHKLCIRAGETGYALEEDPKEPAAPGCRRVMFSCPNHTVTAELPVDAIKMI